MKKKISLILTSAIFSTTAFSQFTYKIKADSVLITKDSCNAELILENGTRNVKGFLYNRGNGRTEFKTGLYKVNDSTYIIGSDTLKLTSGNYIKNQYASRQTARAWFDSSKVLTSNADTVKTKLIRGYDGGFGIGVIGIDSLSQISIQAKKSAFTFPFGWYTIDGRLTIDSAHNAGNTPGGILFLRNWQDYRVIPGTHHVAVVDSRNVFHIAAGRTGYFGDCTSCAGPNEFYGYRAIIGGESSIAATGDALPATIFLARNEIMGTSAVNKLRATNLELVSFGATAQPRAAIDTLGSISQFRDFGLAVNAPNKILKYFSFKSDIGPASNIDSAFGFYQTYPGVRNFFNGYVGVGSLKTGGTAPTTSGTIKMVITDGKGQLSFTDIPGGGSSITADNGLTANTSTNVQLGGALTQPTLINADGDNTLSILGSTSSDGLLQIYNSGTGTTDRGFTSTADGGLAIAGIATGSNVGIYGESQSGYGLHAQTNSSGPGAGLFQLTENSSSSVKSIATFQHFVNAASNGIGVSLDFKSTTSIGANKVSNQIVSKWNNVTDASRTSEFEIWGVNNGAAIARRLALAGNGQLTLDGYGSGTFGGTVSKYLAVDGSGNVIETTGSGGGSTLGIDDVLAVGQSLTTSRSIGLGISNALTFTGIAPVTSQGSFRVYPSYTSNWVGAIGYSGNGISAKGNVNFREWSTGGGDVVTLTPVDNITSSYTINLPEGNNGDTLATKAYARSIAGSGGSTLTLQQVTTAGSKTTNIFGLEDGGGNLIASLDYVGSVNNGRISVKNTTTSDNYQITPIYSQFYNNSRGSSLALFPIFSSSGTNKNLYYPDENTTDTLATRAYARSVGGGGGGNSGYSAIQEDAGSALQARSNLNFGYGVKATDNSGASRTDVDVELNNSQSFLSSDVTLSTANTYGDAVSLTLAAGTWLIAGSATVESAPSTTQRVTYKLWDGTTVYQAGEATSNSITGNVKGYVSLPVSCILVLASSTTVRLSVTSTSASSVIKATPGDNNGGATGKATSIRAVRIK